MSIKSNTAVLVHTALICFILFSCNTAAQQNEGCSELSLLDKNVDNTYVEYISGDMDAGREQKYPSSNLFDGFLKTCWVAGSAKADKIPALYIKLPEDISPDKIILNIFSGYGKSRSLYEKNARPAEIKLSVYSAFYPEGFCTETTELYLIRKYPADTVIELADTFGVQSFPLRLNKKALLDFRQKSLALCKTFSGKAYDYKQFSEGNAPPLIPAFILKIEVEKSRPGTKYDDICLSEIFFNNRYVTAFPEKLWIPEDVYIEDDNTLLADYQNEKRVVILRDTSSVFTMVDWPEKANWAVLHYVRNDEAGAGSRTEELYSLIDLKNRKVVDRQFEKCTGVPPMFLMIEKDEDGGIYLDYDEFKIGLK